MRKVNEMYEAPYLEVAEFEVESGIATSPGSFYGGSGAAGQDSGYVGEEVNPETGDGFWL